MRIVTWNCNMGLHKKIDRLLSLKPDVAILPECASPAILREKAALFVPDQFEWIAGSVEQKGLGVMAWGDYGLIRHDDFRPDFRFILPVQVSGPVAFSLLAVWAMNNSDALPMSDRGPLLRAIEHYRPFLTAGPAVIAGDFNNHRCFDKPGRAHNHENTLAEMESLGMFSAYHEVMKVAHDCETHPTFYWMRNQKQQYHLDYCFLSNAWRERVSRVEVGDCKEWLDYSDHMPLVVDIE